MNKTFVHQIVLGNRNDMKNHVPKQSETIPRFFPNSNFEHKIWDNDSVRDFLRQYFHPSVSLAYNSLIPFAYKADLARYAILYKLGGWYVDATMTVIADPPNVEQYDMFLVRDFYAAEYTAPWQIANGLIYSRPGHPIFMLMINAIVENCKSKSYGAKALSVSGPELFGRKIAEYGYNSKNTKYLIGNYYYNMSTKERHIIYKNINFIKPKPYDGGITKIPGGNSYVDLWEKREVFGKWLLE